MLMDDARLEFPGNCKDKTGANPSRFNSEYKEFLARSFETQTYVFEQAVRCLPFFVLSFES